MKFSVQAIVKALVGLCVFISAVGYSFYSHADNGVDKRVYSINVHASNAADALNALAFQTGAVMLFPYREAKTRQANAVVGDYTIQEAITLMLKDSGLIGSLTSDGAIKIFYSGNQHLKKNDGGRVMNSKKNLLASTIAFFVGVGGAQGLAAEEVGVSNRSAIDEIIVTASKRETSLQDTAMSISALTGETIDKRGLVGMGDYLSSIPGVTVLDRGAGQNSIIIRGLSGDPQTESATAGSYFGETSVSELGGSSAYGGVGNADIKLVDIERIEVLRGPQGTLYGSGSIGGTVRIIPVAPSLEKIEGKVASRFSQTGEEGGDNTMLQGVLNVPLIEDTLAVRAVVYQFDNSGYVKNVAVSQPVAGLAATESFGGIVQDRDDVGNDTYTGIRLSALWRPIDALGITLSYLQQKIEQDGAPEVELALAGAYDQRRFNTGVAGSHDEFLNNEIDITNLVIEYDLGWATVTNSLSVLNYDSEGEQDLTHLYTTFSPFFPGDLADKPYYSQRHTYSDNTTNELRLASQLEGPIQISAGLYYEHIDRGEQETVLWSGSPELQADMLQNPSATSYDTTIKQKAVFGEISYDITEQLKATVGGRYFDYTKDRT
ncbi:MAG: TonB-dependent receptor, partial [Cellvibrionales bacterium]|nr:TonB-dependent receptor [Cellvibrionales bacterium]